MTARWDPYIAKWKRILADERLAPRTISFYTETIRAVLSIMDTIDLRTHPKKIENEDVGKLMDYLAQNDYAIQTRKGYLATLRKYCVAFENPTVHQWQKIRFPHDTRPHADWLTSEQAHDLLSAELTPIQQIVIHLELCLGFRHIEVIRLRTNDIHWDTETIDVRGKGSEGGKPRIVPFTHGSYDVLGMWRTVRMGMTSMCKLRHPKTFEDPEEFIVWEASGILHPYSEEGYGLDKVVTLPLSKQLGFHFSNHTLRRTFGRTLFRANVPVPTIAKILGHESTDVTLKYLGVDLDDMRSAMRRLDYD